MHQKILILICLIVFSSCTKKDPIQYPLSTSVLPSDGGTVSPASGLYHDGESIVLTATPSAEYIFSEWSDGATGSTNPLTVVMNSKKTITANFEKRKYPLSINIVGEGTVKEEVVQTKSVTDYSSGTLVKITAVSNSGSEFIGWSGDHSGLDSSYTITIDKPKTLTVTFNKIIYPTALLSGKDSILIGDSTKLEVLFTGTPPFSFEYNDGEKTYLVSNINSLSYSRSLAPKQSTIFNLVSVKDKKNRNGTVTGSYNVYVQPHFVSKSANYMGINLTVGNIRNNLLFKGSYFHIDELQKSFSFFQIKDNNGVLNDYTMSDHSYVLFDYNNDGYLDLFGFLYNSTNPFGRYNGKYILVNNVLGSKKNIKFFDSDIAWPSGMEVGDFNSDGIMDVVFYSYNNHNDMGGLSLNPARPVKVFLFNKDGTYKEINSTTPLIVHDMTTGDVDNDGDVDMLVWEYDKISKPRLYLNDGHANFAEAPSSNFIGLDEILSSRTDGYRIVAVEIFDINKDGFLDIISGMEIGGRSGDFTYVNDYMMYRISQQRIYWGSGTGKFDLASNYTDLPNNSIKQWSRTQPTPNDSIAIFDQNVKIALGFNFIDFDNDGDYDILTAITPRYSGYILQLHENLGNKTFKDVTIEKIGNYDGSFEGPLDQFGFHIGSDGDFPNFYEIRPYDVDGDGDFDLVPHGVACWSGYKYSKNLYWENVGEKFVLHK